VSTDPISGRLEQWDLELTGEPWSTPSSRLALVRRRGGGAAVLKVPLLAEERLGCRVLRWWDGEGAARVYEIDPSGAVLMERAEPGTPLVAMAKSGRAGDLEATGILMNAIQRLHRRDPDGAPEGLRSLRSWFRELFSWADQAGGFYRRAADLADGLLDDQREVRVLHGDVHHENVIRFGPRRGWLAIDPKGLVGDPIFDYLNLLTNPGAEVVHGPGRFDEQLKLIIERTGFERDRLLQWAMAWAGLSAAWNREIEPVGETKKVIEVGRLAERALG
jgi:streptomycin 6-kinase